MSFFFVAGKFQNFLFTHLFSFEISSAYKMFTPLEFSCFIVAKVGVMRLFD